MENFKPGSYVNQGYYKSFQPEPIDRDWLLTDIELQSMLSKADRQLGRLDMFSNYVPDIDIYTSMHVAKEATQSSRIEGTQTNMEETFLDPDEVSTEKRDDLQEVQNYIRAMKQAIGMLQEIPFSSRLIREAHRTLLQGVRGERKLPGVYRTSQNWIGGASIDDAAFVPPVHTSIEDLMGDLEKFVHSESILLPDLLKVGLMHYQFETIHPFLDGNGRVGRLLITLYLVEKGILKQPVLYLSDFFEKNRSLYYDNLMRAREKGDLTQWLKFFLVGVTETAEHGVRTFDEILKLKTTLEQSIQKLGTKSGKLLKVLDRLWRNPVIRVAEVIEIAGVSQRTAYSMIEELERLGLLEEVTGSKRGRVYSFRKYLKLFE